MTPAAGGRRPRSGRRPRDRRSERACRHQTFDDWSGSDDAVGVPGKRHALRCAATASRAQASRRWRGRLDARGAHTSRQELALRILNTHFDAEVAVPRIDFRCDGDHASGPRLARVGLHRHDGGHANLQTAGFELRHAGFELHLRTSATTTTLCCRRAQQAPLIEVAFDDDARGRRGEVASRRTSRVARDCFGLLQRGRREAARGGSRPQRRLRRVEALLGQRAPSGTGLSSDRIRAWRWRALPPTARAPLARRPRPPRRRRSARPAHGDPEWPRAVPATPDRRCRP